MDNFEEIMSQLAVKTENKFGVTYYEPKGIRTKIIDIRSGNRVNANLIPQQRTSSAYANCKIHTPYGVFDSVKLAAEAQGVAQNTVYVYIRNDPENYYVKKIQ